MIRWLNRPIVFCVLKPWGSHVKEKQKAKVIETARKAEEKVAKEAEKAIAKKKREEEKAAKGLGKAKVKAQENGVKDDAIEDSKGGEKGTHG